MMSWRTEEARERDEIRRSCLEYRRRFNVPASREVHVVFDDDGNMLHFARDRRVHRISTTAEDVRR